MTKVNKSLGDKIRKFRKYRSLVQEEVAHRAKLDYSYYNQIENGRRNPSVNALTRIAKVLEVSLKDLF